MSSTLSAPPPLPRRRSPLIHDGEYLDWLTEGTHADLIQGSIHMHSPVSFRHARLVGFVEHLLSAYVRQRRLGEVHRETIAVRLSPLNVFLPDVCYFTNEQVAALAPSHAPFAPTLVVEVLSEATRDRDLGVKFAAYEEHGVREYWVLDPAGGPHRFFRRESTRLEEFAENAELVRSEALPGFWLRRGWLAPEALPPEEACLAEILPQ